MWSMYAIKPFYQRLFRGLAGSWMTPNMATGFGILFSLLVGAAYLLGGGAPRLGIEAQPLLLLLVPVGQFFRMGANALDGMLAREKGLASPLGAVLNEVTDVVNDMICYVPLWFVPGVERIVLLAFVLLIFFAEFSGLLGQAVAGRRRYEGPLGGKTDRATWMGLFALVCALQPGAMQSMGWYMGLVCALVLLTAVNRLRLTVAEAAHAEAKP
jgi:CDP-diacylglycerol--glycerol-3-phosphate 3-phosphatidyltransferase